MVGERLHKGTRVRNSARELDRRRRAGRFNGPQDVLESKEFSVLAARRKKEATRETPENSSRVFRTL